MKLLGNYLSPFARRVAISLHAVELPFKMQTVFVSKNPEQVRPFNPVVRISALVLDDGETLVALTAERERLMKLSVDGADM